MNIEEEIFQRSTIQFDRLLKYGFVKEEQKFKFSKNILKDTFRVQITVTESGKVMVNVYDLAFQEEYTNYRIETQTGEFVGRIRRELELLLRNIKEQCTTTEYFKSSQANRIAKKIQEKYGDIPEFAWEDSPGFGIFRHSNHQKWYGLIMNISKTKLGGEEKEVEIINLKLTKPNVQSLQNQKGYYKAYHMNKENWISILLDDTLLDEEIMKWIDESYQLTK